MHINPVAWFEIYVNDMDRARRFYQAVFQGELQKLDSPLPEGEIWAFPMKQESYGASGALVKMPGFPAAVGGSLVYFHCEDCAVEQGRVEAAGGKIERPKFSIGPYGNIALVRDSEGNMIGLHSM